MRFVGSECDVIWVESSRVERLVVRGSFCASSGAGGQGRGHARIPAPQAKAPRSVQVAPNNATLTVIMGQRDEVNYCPYLREESRIGGKSERSAAGATLAPNHGLVSTVRA